MNTPTDEPPVLDSKRLIAINSACKYGALIVGNLIAFFLTPYLIRTLGPALLGLKTLAWQALQFVGLAHTAMGISYERYAKADHARGDYESLNRHLSAGFLVSALAAIAFALGSVALAVWAAPLFSLPPELVPPARAVFLLIGFSTAFLILTGVWETPAFVAERFYLQDLGHLVCSLLSAALVVWAFEYGTPSIVLWVLLSNGLLVLWRAAVMMPLARRLLPTFRVSLALIRSSSEVRSMMAFGGLNFVGGIGFLLYYASDSIVITNLRELGPEMIVHYNVAQRWDPQIRVLVMAFVTTLLPLMTAQAARGERAFLQRTFLRGTRYSLLIGAPFAALLVAYADPFLRHWVGPDFAREGAVALQVIMLQFLVCIPERMAYNVNIAYARMKGPVLVALACGVLNIVLSVAFVRIGGLGLLGIALGSAFALLAISAYSVAHALRLMNLGVRAWFALGCLRPLLAVIPFFGCAFALRVWDAPANLLHVFLHFGLCGALWPLIAWRVGFTREDRLEARRALRGLAARVGLVRSV
jgi:O-antigen/teichoic acid export membrane protein